MTTYLTKNNQELTEKLTGLKEAKSTQELLQGLKAKERVDKVLLILLDCSGSMSESIHTMPSQSIPHQTRPLQPAPNQSDPNQSKIEVAWYVFQTQLMPNMAGWTYGVLLFGEGVYWEVMPTVDTKALVSRNAPAPMGSTPMGKALQQAWSWVQGNARQARFIVLSDGQPNDMSKEAILEMAKGNASIPIDTIGIGSGSWDYDPMFLQNLSNITGGIFTEASSVQLLADTIKKLSPIERPLLGTVKER